MAPITIRPTHADLSVANAISAHTGSRTERAAEFLTWGADEHILCALAAGWWLYCRGKNANARRASDHIFLTTVVSSGLPHILKMVFDQERPDHRPFRGTGGVSRSQASGSTHFHLAIPYTSGRWLPRPVRFP
jgi:hypothetical protein